jgi:outer membrane receptor protein involved in Fe transport
MRHGPGPGERLHADRQPVVDYRQLCLFQNKVEQTVTLQDGPGVLELEPDVPYDDTSHVGSLALTVAPSEGLSLTGSASKSYSRGSFRLAGAGGVTNVSGIAELSDLKVVDTVYTAGVEMEFNRYLSSELRYEHQDYDDEIDSAQDGKVRLILATVFLNW